MFLNLNNGKIPVNGLLNIVMGNFDFIKKYAGTLGLSFNPVSCTEKIPQQRAGY
jgi:hypothetical protein